MKKISSYDICRIVNESSQELDRNYRADQKHLIGETTIHLQPDEDSQYRDYIDTRLKFLNPLSQENLNPEYKRVQTCPNMIATVNYTPSFEGIIIISYTDIPQGVSDTRIVAKLDKDLETIASKIEEKMGLPVTYINLGG